ncbi:MAG: hypothetical protein ACFFAS_16685 [Promethearchaeota archaeon]
MGPDPSKEPPKTQVIVFRHTSGYSIDNYTSYCVDFNYESFDPGNNFNLDTDRYIAPIDGTYLVSGSLVFSDSVYGDKYHLKISVDGNIRGEVVLYAIDSYTSISIVQIIQLEAENFVQLRVRQYNPGYREIYGGINECTYLSISLI